MKLIIEHANKLDITDIGRGHIVTTDTGLVGITTDEESFPVLIIADEENENMTGVLLNKSFAVALHWFDGGEVIMAIERDS